MLWAQEPKPVDPSTLPLVVQIIGYMVTACIIPVLVWLAKTVSSNRKLIIEDRDSLLDRMNQHSSEKDKIHKEEVVILMNATREEVSCITQAFKEALDKSDAKNEATNKYEREQCKEQHDSVLGRLDEISKVITANQVASERQAQALQAALAEHRRGSRA